MMNLKSHSNIAFGYFLVAAILGLVLRSFQVFEIPLEYKFIKHAHSHIALLGWVYLALTTLIYKLFIQSVVNEKKYKTIFWFTQFTLVGMLLSFPFQGYALFSIIFSTLFLFATYWFYWFFKKHSDSDLRQRDSYKCVKYALLYMVISSIGPWSLGAIMNTLGAGSIWYRLSIYFYLHFQYNGWMVLALFGLLFFILEQKDIILAKEKFKTFFILINVGILSSFFLSTLFTKPIFIFYILGGLGAISQFLALFLFVRYWIKNSKEIKVGFTLFQNELLVLLSLLLVIKMSLQLVSVVPYFANLASTFLDFTIGYLHLTFLGFVTLSIFLFLDYYRLLNISKKAYYIYLIGFLATELLIFYKAIAGWLEWQLMGNYTIVLWLVSLLIPISLVLICFKNGRLCDK